MKIYPTTATERFDDANFHIKYCLSFLKKYMTGKILEVGAGCGSFTKNYTNLNFTNITLTELDEKNIQDLKQRFNSYKNIKILDCVIDKVVGEFDTILYLHVLEHIKNDRLEIEEAEKKLKKGGYLIIMVPAHQKIYGNLDKAVGHFRRYEEKFFEQKISNLEKTKLLYLDSIGYLLYYLNKIFFKKEVYPSKLKIFLWDKIFTPLTIIIDRLTNYKFGKCIIAIYKKN
tara:strand:- start:932 stop:1618 length:687 start_codon:yes stop_codon:yes gene_type:complete